MTIHIEGREERIISNGWGRDGIHQNGAAGVHARTKSFTCTQWYGFEEKRSALRSIQSSRRLESGGPGVRIQHRWRGRSDLVVHLGASPVRGFAVERPSVAS